jgi:FkbM family methyltransferase
MKVGFKSLQNKYFETQSESTIELFGYKFNFLAYSSFNCLFKEIFLKEDYFFKTQKERPFIIDCGSNIGASILYFKKLYPKALITGFEPFEQAFKALKSNIDDNKLQDVTVYNMALAGSNGQQKLFYDPSKPSSLCVSLLEERIKGTSTYIQTTVLSKFITQTVDFLKIDIEGAELTVLEELNESKKLSLVEQIAIEYHHHIDKNIDCLSRMLGILEQNNFGYHINCYIGKSLLKEPRFQDIMIYAYKKTTG